VAARHICPFIADGNQPDDDCKYRESLNCSAGPWAAEDAAHGPSLQPYP